MTLTHRDFWKAHIICRVRMGRPQPHTIQKHRKECNNRFTDNPRVTENLVVMTAGILLLFEPSHLIGVYEASKRIGKSQEWPGRVREAIRIPTVHK